MTLTELRYIVAVAQYQHFGRAAEACHVSQPTLSLGIKKLEEELGVELFERSVRNVLRITAVGMRVIEQAQRVLEQASLQSLEAVGDVAARRGRPVEDIIESRP